MNRILLRTADATYRLLDLDFKDDKDGSLYFFTKTVRQADGSGGKTFQLSYHTTGRVHFTAGDQRGTVFGEPIFAISRPQRLCCVSLADIGMLPKVEIEQDGDLIADCVAINNERLSLDLVIAPLDTPALGENAIIIGILTGSASRYWLDRRR